MALFTAMCLQANNITQVYNQSIDIDQPEAGTPVDSVIAGRVGYAPGPQITTISLSNVRLEPDQNFDWEKAKANYSEIPIRVFQLGGLREMTGNFVCTSVKISTSGPGTPTIESMTLSSVGTPAPRFQ